MTLARPWIRTLAYTLIVMSAAATAIFSGLSADRIWGDEAVYASCVDTIHETGQWLSPAPFPGAHYFQKPPLQMWLSVATYRFFPDVMRYRVWPAAFGVMSAGIVCLLAASMFGPEVGLLAGLLLATNNRFLFEHGARAGTFDSGLTFFTLLATAIYWRVIRRRLTPLPGTPGEGGDEGSVTSSNQSPIAAEPSPSPLPEYRKRNKGTLLGWIVLGVAVGLAGLLKPLAGLPLLLLLALHAITLPRIGARRRWIGLVVALIVSIFVTIPWFAVQAFRFGGEFWHEIVGRNIVDRATIGIDPRHLHEALYYGRVISRATTAFALALPAMLFAVIASFGSTRRVAWRLIAIVGVGWIVVFSLSQSKASHYLYPAFPAISICIAGLLAWTIDRIAGAWKNEEYRGRAKLAGYGGLTAAMVLNAVWFGASRFSQPEKQYEPYEVYRAFEPAIRSGSAKFVIAGYSGDTPIWYGRAGLEATDLFYLRRMPGVGVADDAALKVALDQHMPMLLMLARGVVSPAIIEPKRIDRRFIAEAPGYTVCGVDLDAITKPRVEFPTGKFVDSITVNVPLAIQGRGELTIGATLTGPVEPPVLCKVVIDGKVLSESSAVVTGNTLSAEVPIGRDWLPIGQRQLELRWRPLQGVGHVSGKLDSVELSIDPRQPD